MTMLRGFFGNIFAIIAQMLCGNHLHYIRMIIQVSRQAVSSPSWLLLVFWHMVDFWARLKKTLSFVSGEQLDQLFARPKADANNNYWSTSHWQKSWCFPITKFNNWFIIQSPFFWSTKCVRSLRLCLLGELMRHFHTRG